jgi:hypothetical protein
MPARSGPGILQSGQRRTAGPSWSVAAFAPVHGDVLESLEAVSAVGFAFEVEAGAGVAAAAAVPYSVAEVVVEWTSATEHVVIVVRIERESAAGVGLGAVVGPEVVP